MGARLAAAILLIVPLWSCVDLGPVGSASGFGDISYGFGGLDGAELLPHNGSLRVEESVHVTARLTNPTLTRLHWLLSEPGAPGDGEFLGFVCVPATACAIERIGLSRDGTRDATLRLHGATEVTTRVRALRPGNLSLSIGAYAGGPCGNPPEECGRYAFSSAYFRVDP